MKKQERIYSCKNEELLPIAKFTQFSLKRDLAEFTAFSAQFNDEYVASTEAMITEVENLLQPENETLALKLIFQNMDQQFMELQKNLYLVEGYVKLSKSATGLTTTSIGVSSIRKSLNKRDPESILKGMKILITNLQTHSSHLEQKGMPVTLIKTLQDIQVAIAENKQKQFEIRTGRADLVQNNQQVLNNLYFRLTEIYTIGKVLYKNSNPAKYKDYTFTQLKKKVRNVKGSTFDVASSTTEVPIEATNS